MYGLEIAESWPEKQNEWKYSEEIAFSAVSCQDPLKYGVAQGLFDLWVLKETARDNRNNQILTPDSDLGCETAAEYYMYNTWNFLKNTVTWLSHCRRSLDW
jgi:hypothetical protein